MARKDIQQLIIDNNFPSEKDDRTRIQMKYTSAIQGYYLVKFEILKSYVSVQSYFIEYTFS